MMERKQQAPKGIRLMDLGDKTMKVITDRAYILARET